jgi:hypothetical protein
MAGPKQFQNLRVSALNVVSSIAALYVHSVDTSGAYVSPGSGSTQVSIKEILSSSGGSLIDSTNVSLGVTIRAGSAAGTEYTDGDVDATISGQAILFDNSSNTLRPVTIARGLPVNIVAGSASSTETTVRQSTYTDFNTLSRLADRDASTNVANVTNTTPASTAYALAVREVGPVICRSSAADFAATVSPAAGSTWNTRPLQSSAADLQMTATPAAGSTWNVRPLQPSAADLQATVTPAAGSTWAVRPLQSSQADLRVTVYQSTAGDFQGTVQLRDSSGAVINASTGPTVVGANGLVTREVMPTIQSTTVLITSTNSTALYALISSVAGQRQKVFAYFASSTHTVPSTLVFMSSNVIDRWHVGFGSGSSGMTGANLALSPPSWIFHTDAANALNVRIEGGSSAASTVIVRISIGWFSEA